VARWQGRKVERTYIDVLFSLGMLRTGRVSVVIRRLVHHSWQGPAGKVQLDRDKLFARGRHSTDRIFLCL
jgi:hypothetical protein